MAAKKKADIFARLEKSTKGKGGHSSLYRWFLLHHDRFAALLAGTSRPGWQAIADELTIEGLTTYRGQKITAAYARLAWWKAERTYKAKRQGAPALSPQPQPPPAAPVMPSQSVPQAVVVPVEDEKPSKPKFGFASVKDWTKPNKGDE